MPKTVSPSAITIPDVATFITNAMPDPFDARDLEYRPRLQPLPRELDQRSLTQPYVMHQEGQSCTGHAVATLVNIVLASIVETPPGGVVGSPHVSPYMLYRLARRYDEFEGEEDAGSSLRGVFKGWFHHGVALFERWDQLHLAQEPDLEDEAFIDHCAERPLGAFYRVNPYRLDDMQSAISELHAIAVSAVIHDGWVEPTRVTQNGRSLHVISRKVNGRTLGGHAFALVGYNEVGFLVQNSWGAQWGKDGYATLPYEDWLESAYDAWVARPGVPKTPFTRGWTRTAPATGGDLATAPGPDLRRLDRHVVNLGNDGRLSTTGKFVSTPDQIERIFAHLQLWQDAWAQVDGGGEQHVVLYAHGGLVDEAGGLETAQKHLNWWLNNRVYPIYFAWQSGPAETLVNQLVDTLQPRLPFGLGFDFMEQVDRLVEKAARQGFTWMWDQMKQNARAASEPLDGIGPLPWPPTGSADKDRLAAQPGASLVAHRLAAFVRAQDNQQIKLHLVGHSAGAIFLASLLDRLAEEQLPVESMAFLAPALRVDDFVQKVLPHLGRTVARFATFAMRDQRELDDVCGANGMNVYHKSLLYLVSRALEHPGRGDAGEVPLLGMERFLDRARPGGTVPLREEIPGACIISRSAAPADSRSDATSHGGFDDDAPTMTSVVLRVRGLTQGDQVDDYVPHAALNALPGQVPLPLAASRPPAVRPDGPPAEPPRMAAAVNVPGETPLVETAEPQEAQPVAPVGPTAYPLEVADAPRTGSAVLDVLAGAGWRIDSSAATDSSDGA